MVKINVIKYIKNNYKRHFGIRNYMLLIISLKKH